MSNPPELSPKSPALAKQTLRKLKEILISPYGVAAIASLSFHAVLFAAIPRFSSASFAAFSEDNATPESRTVPLVTLSPAEQGRLPDFNRPQLPSIPNVSSPPSLNNLPNASTFNRSNIFNRSSSNRITTPSFGSPSRLSRNRPFRNPYIPRPNLSIANTPSRSAQSSDRRTAIIDNIPKPPAGSASELNTDQDTLDRELALEQAQAEAAEQAEGLPELPEQSDQSATPEEDTPSEIAANSETETQPTRLERLQAKFKYDEANTSEDTVDERYTEWLAQATGNESSETLAIDTANIQTLDPIDSGLSLCVDNPPSAGKVGILVAPDGTSSEPVVLLSTGYEELNQAVLEGLINNPTALKELVNTEFPEAETAVPYVFEFPVTYDAETCKSSQDVLDAVQTAESNPSEE